MPVPTVMNDLSATASSNSPAGTETIGTSLDDYLRGISAILRTTNHKGTDIASASTTNIGAASGEFVDVTGSTTITALGTIGAGIVRTVRFTGSLTLTHNSSSLILPGGVNITTQNGDVCVFRSLGSGNWVCTSHMPKRTFASYRRIDAQIFTASGTWTRPLGTLAVQVRVVGGGGGGGGAEGGVGTTAGAGGGGGGGTSEEWITSGIGSTETVTVGTGGAGGSTAGSNGSAGVASSFGSHCTANGGAAGIGAGAGTAVQVAPGGAGGTSSGGGLNSTGSPGGAGIRLSGSVSTAGDGGSSTLGGGGDAPTDVNSAGSAGGLYGGGGSGANGENNATGVAGGAGADGVVIVEAYGL